MKANFNVQWGTAPAIPKSYITVRGNFGAEQGKAAQQKFSALFGQDFSVGVVLHAPTTRGEEMKNLVNLDSGQNIIEDLFSSMGSLIHQADATGFYVGANLQLDQGGVPPQLTGSARHSWRGRLG